jgi:small GTP-binding protein
MRAGVGKSTLLATWREGRYPAELALPSTVYDWLYFNYCLSSKALLLEHLQKQLEQEKMEEQQTQDKAAEVQDKKDEEELKEKAEEPIKSKEEVKERREIVIEFLDTAGEYEGFRHLRPWHYKDVDVFILTFDVTNRESFANIVRYWTEEIKTWSTSCTKILVGTKVDIADDEDDEPEPEPERARPLSMSLRSRDGGEIVLADANASMKRTRRKVSKEEAEQLAKRIDAVTYVEISSVTQLNLSSLLELCVAQVFEDLGDEDKPSVVEAIITELTTPNTASSNAQ